MFLRVPVKAKTLSTSTQLLLARLFVLSDYGKHEVIYTDKQASEDGFTRGNVRRALKELQQDFLKVTTNENRLRVIQVLVKKSEDDLILNLPNEYLQAKYITLSAKPLILLARLITLVLAKGNPLTYTNLQAKEELNIGSTTMAETLNLFVALNFISYEKKMARSQTIRIISIIDENLLKKSWDQNCECRDQNRNCRDQNCECKGSKLKVLGIKTESVGDQKRNSSISSDHINDLINEDRNTFTFDPPKDYKECIPLFQEILSKKAEDFPEYRNYDPARLADRFFDYFSKLNWHDKKGKPVKNLKDRIRTWIINAPKYDPQINNSYKKPMPQQEKRSTYEELQARYGHLVSNNLTEVEAEATVIEDNPLLGVKK